MTALLITFTVFMLLANIAAHEAAHALALRGLGGRIDRAGLGIPIGVMLEIAPRGRRDFTLTLSPWLIGAYVEPDRESEKLIENAGYRDQAWFAGAGVIANLIIGLATMTVIGIYRGSWQLIVFPIITAGLVWVLRKLITAVLPLFGVAALALLVWALIDSVGEPAGPVGVVQAVIVEDLGHALATSAGMAFALAILNMIPIFPFDGGRVADAALSKSFGPKVSGRFRVATGVAAFTLIAYAVGSDVWWLAAGWVSP